MVLRRSPAEQDDESVLPLLTSSFLKPPAKAGGTGALRLGLCMTFT